jgi:hypothetical protein
MQFALACRQSSARNVRDTRHGHEHDTALGVLQLLSICVPERRRLRRAFLGPRGAARHTRTASYARSVRAFLSSLLEGPATKRTRFLFRLVPPALLDAVVSLPHLQPRQRAPGRCGGGSPSRANRGATQLWRLDRMLDASPAVARYPDAAFLDAASSSPQRRCSCRRRRGRRAARACGRSTRLPDPLAAGATAGSSGRAPWRS